MELVTSTFTLVSVISRRMDLTSYDFRAHCCCFFEVRLLTESGTKTFPVFFHFWHVWQEASFSSHPKLTLCQGRYKNHFWTKQQTPTAISQPKTHKILQTLYKSSQLFLDPGNFEIWKNSREIWKTNWGFPIFSGISHLQTFQHHVRQIPDAAKPPTPGTRPAKLDTLTLPSSSALKFLGAPNGLTAKW